MKPSTNSMHQLMDALAADKELELPMDAAFYDRMHAKIMAEVDKSEIAPAPWFEKPRRLIKAHWRSWAVVSGSFSCLLLVSHLAATGVNSLLTQAPSVLAAQEEDRLVQEAMTSPDDLSTSILFSEASSELFVDVASQSFENLSIAKFNRVMGEERN